MNTSSETTADTTELPSTVGPDFTVGKLPAVMDAAGVAALLRCGKQHVEILADRGQLPGTKYGRGWIFVTTQLLQVVTQRCAANLKTPIQDQQQRFPPPPSSGSSGTRKRGVRGYRPPIPPEILRP